MASALGAAASAETVTMLPSVDGTRVVVVGLDDADVTPERVRRAAGSASAASQGSKGRRLERRPLPRTGRPRTAPGGGRGRAARRLPGAEAVRDHGGQPRRGHHAGLHHRQRRPEGGRGRRDHHRGRREPGA
ncbi:M17 family peptidase N-terminal domain-containing protein [Tessaracoccus coleopterorum]|nr:M17 family peptidase N-terminal domain-containing protein [Tessaracoccus coleopterorum]